MGATDEARFTEDQVQLLVDSAVAKETASLQATIDALTSEKAAAESQATELANQLATSEGEKAELSTRIEVVEAEKAAAESARDAVTSEFETYKAELAEMAAQGERKETRVKEVAAAAPHLSEAFLSDAGRQQRWTEMSDDQFAVLVEGFRESAREALTPAERELVEKASDKDKAVSEVLAARVSGATTKDMRETAAFTGDATATSTTTTKAGESSKLGAFFANTGRRPVSA